MVWYQIMHLIVTRGQVLNSGEARLDGCTPNVWTHLLATAKCFKRIEARKMEIYAAMIDDADRYLGKLIAYLKEVEEYDKTFIFVMSDNGPEGHKLTEGWPAVADWVKKCCDNS